MDETNGVVLTTQTVLHLRKVLLKHGFRKKLFDHLKDHDWQEIHALVDRDPGELKAKIRSLRTNYEQKCSKFAWERFWKTRKTRKTKKSTHPKSNLFKTHLEDPELPTVIFLGTHFAGKSTLLAFLEMVYGDPEKFGLFENCEVQQIISENILEFAILIVQNRENLKFSRELVRWEEDDTCREATEFLDTLDNSDELTREAAEAIKILFTKWEAEKRLEDPRFLYRGQVFENVNFKYFLDKIYEFVEPTTYKMTMEDYMRMRVRTVGIEKTVLTFQERKVSFINVAGGQCERDRWPIILGKLENATHKVVVFVASLSAYGEELWEWTEHSTDRMIDSISSFGDLMNSPEVEDAAGFCLISSLLFAKF